MKCRWNAGCENEAVYFEALCLEHRPKPKITADNAPYRCEGNALVPRCDPPTLHPDFESWLAHIQTAHGVPASPVQHLGKQE